MIPHNDSRRVPADHKDLEIERLKRQLADARGRERRARAEERERFSALSGASKRFVHSMRSRMDERRRQQRRLDAQYAVSRTLEEAHDLQAAAPGILRALGERLGWDVGVLWTVDGDALRCDGVWRGPGGERANTPPGGFEAACASAGFRRGAGLPGRVWLREEACWVEDVLLDPQYVRRDAAAAEGLRCAMGFPIQDGGRLVGVFELLKGEPSEPDEDMLRMVYLVGHQMGQFVERRRAEAERDRALFREREARREATGVLESINDAFFAVDGDWRFTYVNRRAEEFWETPRGELLGKSMWQQFPQAVGSEAAGQLRRAMEGSETVGFESVSPVTGAWISSRAYPSADGISVYFRDVTESKKAEEELRRSEERFRALVSEGADMITVSDREGKITYASPTTERVSGYAPEEFSALHPFDLIHPEDRPRCEGAFGRLVEEPGLSLDLKHRVRHKDGRWRWVEGTFTSLFHDPAIGGLVANVRDVTENERAERRLRESEERFRTLAANIPGAVFRASVRDGQPSMEFLSDRIEGITGYPSGDFVSDRIRNYRDVVHPEDRPRNDREVWRALEEREPYNIEYRIVRADGENRWANERGTGVYDADGSLLWVDGAIFDITERKRSDRRLAESEARFRAAFEQARVGIVQASLDGRILVPNAGFCTIVGYTEEEARCLHVRDLTHPEDYEADMEQAARVLAGEIPGYTIEKRYVRKDGRVVWVSMTSTLVRDAAGEPQYALAMVEDIDERKKTEEKLRESEGRQAFLLELSDAMRPLTNPAQIEGEACRLLAGRLDVGRAYYVEVDERADVARVGRDFVRDGSSSLAGEHRVADFSWSVEILRRGECHVISDIQTSPLVPPAERPASAALGIVACMGAPLIKAGRLVGALCVTDPRTREWSEGEVGLLREVGERVWSAVERARAEEALRESEERFRAIAELVPDLLWSNDPEGVTGWYNRRWTEYTGQSFEEASDHGWLAVVHPDDREAFRARFGHVVESGEPPRREHRLRGADGRYRWFLVQARPVRDKEGRVTRWFGAATDVHEQRTALETLREYDEWLRIAQRAARSGTWEWDLGNDEIRWSSEHRELFGFDPSDEPVTREEWWGAVHPEDLPRIEEAGRRCSEGGEEWPEIQYRIKRDGETRWIDARGRTVKDEDDRPVRILGISVDVTERKEAEAERDRLLAREWVASAEAAERERISRELHDRVAHSMGVAHQSLQLYEVLREKRPEKAAEKLDLARATTKAALESTRNLSAELRHLEAEDDLEAELGHLLDVSVPPHVGADLRVEGDEAGVPGYVRGQVFLILREAVRNAVSHSGCDSLSVGLEVRPEEIVGRVEDDGRGFDANDGNGGVGLRSMRERTALLDGALNLDCEPGRGTRVEISVPLKGGR